MDPNKHTTKFYSRLILDEIIVLKIKRVREIKGERAIWLLLCTRSSYGNYSHIIMEATRLMKIASPMVSHFGRVPKKASKSDRGRTEACGGRRIVSEPPSGF